MGVIINTAATLSAFNQRKVLMTNDVRKAYFHSSKYVKKTRSRQIMPVGWADFVFIVVEDVTRSTVGR